MQNDEKYSDIDRLLNSISYNLPSITKPTLKQLFEARLTELNISTTAAAEIIGIEWRALAAILEGTQKLINFVSLSKMARFLKIPNSELVEIFLIMLEENNKDEIADIEKAQFVIENFDLAVLKKAGVIDDANDFNKIEQQLNSLFGFNSIFEYTTSNIQPAFSAGAIKPKNLLTRNFWIEATIRMLKKINNPYEYDRKGLIEFFPKIRWHSMNVEMGMLEVVKSLYKLGITVIYQPYIETLHLRGATLSINNKPCIALTDYKGFYPTLWFALVHELYHVLFDWEEIKDNKYHLSEEELDFFTTEEKEAEANSFAREYLFSKDKIKEVKSFLRNKIFVETYAKNNHVHPSIIYIFSAFEESKNDKKAFANIHRKMPNIELCLNSLVNTSWKAKIPISNIVDRRKTEIFNNL